MQNVTKTPMLHTSDVYVESFDSFQESQLFRRLEKKFSPLPYYLKFRPLQRIALFTSYLFNVFSALTACALVFFFVDEMIGHGGVAAIITVAALTVLELGKRKTSGMFFKDWLQFRQASTGLAALALLLAALSISASYFGAKQMVEQFTPPPILEDASDATAPFQAQVAEIDRQIEKHMANKNGNGEVYMRSQKTAESLTKQKETLLAQWLKIENRTATKNETTAAAHLHQTALKAEHFAAITLLLEILFLLCAFYLQYFDFRSFAEFVSHAEITGNDNAGFAYTKPNKGLQPPKQPQMNSKMAIGDANGKAPETSLNGKNPEPLNGQPFHLNAVADDAVQKAIKHVRGRIASAAHRLRNGIGRPETSKANIERHTAELKELEAMA